MQRSARIELIKTGLRTRLARNSQQKKDQLAWKIWFIQNQQALVKQNKYVREERQNRREDWLAGPLASNRNAGAVRGAYGAVDGVAVTPIQIPRNARTTVKHLGLSEINDDGSVSPELAFKGKTVIGNIIENDRVVVVEGPARIKGLVGTVKTVGKDSETIIIKDVNLADVASSKLAKAYTPGGRLPTLFETTEIPIPLKNVRLVYDIENPRTGRKKAVIIRHVHADGPYLARTPFSSWPSHTRYATGTGHLTEDGKDIRLDWPEEIPGEIPRRLSDDTSSVTVEEVNWKPTLRESPIGYPMDIKQQKEGEAAANRYTAGIPPSLPESAFERLGLAGFVSYKKLDERKERIAAGIMAELHGSKRVLKQDPADHLKKKIMEDARAIWWKERQLLSPAAEAAKKAAEEKKERREAQLPKMDVGADLAVDTKLLENIQTLSLKNRYEKADRRLSKRLLKNSVAKPQSLHGESRTEGSRRYQFEKQQPDIL